MGRFSKYTDEIDDKELNIIFSRFYPYRTLAENIFLGSTVLGIGIFCLLVIRFGWVTAILVEIGIVFVLILISLRGLRKNITKFKEEVDNNETDLKEEYLYNWKNDKVGTNRYTRKITNGDYVFVFYIIFLGVLKFFYPENVYFNFYFFIILIGTGAVIISSKSLRNKYIPVRFRKIYSPLLSKIFSWQAANFMIVDLLWGVVVFYAVYKLVLFPEIGSIWFWVLFLPVIYFVETVNRFFVSKGTLLILKRIIDRNFNIVVFRRFREEYIAEAKNIIYPVLGAYGQIYSIQDEHLINARSGIGVPDVFGEYYSLEYATDNNWKYNVIRYLVIADFVFFYWPDEPSINMWWEFDMSVNAIPVYRLCIITKNENKSMLMQIIQTKYSDFDLSELKFIYSDSSGSFKRFGKEVSTIMNNLKTESKYIA